MNRLRDDESGFTLVELLLVSVLMLIVLGATLTTFNSFQSNAALNERQSNAQDEARRSIDTLARELRNLASPVDYDPDSVKRAEPDDLIVQSVGTTRPGGSLNARNTQFVRYCYDAANKRVHRQNLTWVTEAAPAVPAGTSCPASGWNDDVVVAHDIVNDELFTYNGTSLDTITEIHSRLVVDADPGRRPKAVDIETTVFLRNQNRVPVARFTADVTANGSILLNGSASEDPEERELRYFWYDVAVGKYDPSVPESESPHVGEGIVFTYKPDAPGPRDVYLVVKDPADLVSEAPVEHVCVPGGGC